MEFELGKGGQPWIAIQILCTIITVSYTFFFINTNYVINLVNNNLRTYICAPIELLDLLVPTFEK